MPTCKNCNEQFPNKVNINGKLRALSGRKFCTKCSPIDGRNTRSYIINMEDNEAYCVRCQKIKNKNDFYIRKNSGNPFSYCRKCQEQVKLLKLEEKISSIVQERGGACKDCEQVYPAAIYDFYCEGKGTYNLSKVKNMSLQRFKKEIREHEMLCKNCCALRKWEQSA